MTALLKRQPERAERLEMFDWLDHLFEDWTQMLPFRRGMAFGRDLTDEMIRVDEFRENGTLVVRAELPGIDPDKDVELTVTDRMLHIQAERREEETSDEKSYTRHELRYGSFARDLTLPEGVTESDIKASYRDGVLEIRIPVPETQPVAKIPIAKS